MDKKLFNLIIDSKKPLWVIKRNNLDIKVFFSGKIEGIESPPDDPMFVYNVFTNFIAHLLHMIKHYCPPNSNQSLRDLVSNFDYSGNISDSDQYSELNQH
jgi:hypothetical protein